MSMERKIVHGVVEDLSRRNFLRGFVGVGGSFTADPKGTSEQILSVLGETGEGLPVVPKEVMMQKLQDPNFWTGNQIYFNNFFRLFIPQLSQTRRPLALQFDRDQYDARGRSEDQIESVMNEACWAADLTMIARVLGSTGYMQTGSLPDIRIQSVYDRFDGQQWWDESANLYRPFVRSTYTMAVASLRKAVDLMIEDGHPIKRIPLTRELSYMQGGILNYPEIGEMINKANEEVFTEPGIVVMFGYKYPKSDLTVASGGHFALFTKFGEDGNDVMVIDPRGSDHKGIVKKETTLSEYWQYLNGQVGVFEAFGVVPDYKNATTKPWG